MEYTTVSDLKNQAKKLRKNNPNVKNHTDSLNKIAQEHDFKNWQNLLDSCVLPKRKDLNKSVISNNELKPNKDYDHYAKNLYICGEMIKKQNSAYPRLKNSILDSMYSIEANIFLLNTFLEQKNYEGLSAFLFEKIVLLETDASLHVALIKKFLTKFCKMAFEIEQTEIIKSNKFISNLFFLLDYRNFSRSMYEEYQSESKYRQEMRKVGLEDIDNFNKYTTQIFYMDELDSFYRIFGDLKEKEDIIEYFKNINNIAYVFNNPLCFIGNFSYSDSKLKNYSYITSKTNFEDYYVNLIYAIKEFTNNKH